MSAYTLNRNINYSNIASKRKKKKRNVTRSSILEQLPHPLRIIVAYRSNELVKRGE